MSFVRYIDSIFKYSDDRAKEKTKAMNMPREREFAIANVFYSICICVFVLLVCEIL